jgi:hypothetical protein
MHVHLRVCNFLFLPLSLSLFCCMHHQFYGMGLFHASGKRLKVSWGMVFGISAIVALCKKVPAPWRSVVDGGVVR